MARQKFSSKQTFAVLKVLLECDQVHGYAIVRETGLDEGTVYPILKRLEKAGYLDAQWEFTSERGPPRKMFTLNAAGVQLTRERLRARQVELTSERR